MSISTHRGSRRVFRRTQSKRFLVTLPKTRKGLLLGSSLCGGSLMLLGATLFMPNAAMAACGISSPGVIDCSGTFTGQYTTPGLTGDQQVNIDTGTDWESTGGTGTLGLLNIDNSTGASDSIYGSFKSDNGPPNSTTKIETNGSGRVNQSAIAVQFVSGSDGVIHINNIDPAVSITGYNDALRLRTGSVSTDSITLGGEGGIEVHTQGTLKSTIRGEGIDAKAGNGGIGIFVDGGSVSSEGSQGIVAQTGAHWDSESGWSGGNIDIAVAYNATVTGDAGGPTNDYRSSPAQGIYAFISDSESDGNITVTNEGDVTGLTAGITATTAGSGDVTVGNTGHVEGKSGIVISGADGGVGTITNHSLHSVIGSGGAGNVGASATGFDQVIFNNEGGLTAATGGGNIGASITDISGNGHPDAVHVYNSEGGIIAGNGGGLDIAGVGSVSETGNVTVDNSATYLGHHNGFSEGGLIVASASGDAVHAEDVYGSFTVDNTNTLHTGVDLNGVDTQVYDRGTESGLLYGFAGGDGGSSGTVSSGIYGAGTGVYGTGISGDANVYNDDGVIYGGTTNGVYLATIGDNVDIENAQASTSRWYHSDGGLIAGGATGAYVAGVGGTVDVNNVHGDIIGLGTDGISITTVHGEGGGSNGDAVAIHNAHGLIYGGTDGVFIAGVSGNASEGDATNVLIDNSASWSHHHLSAGGGIYGESGAGIEISSVESSEGAGGNVTIDNINTSHTSINLADQGYGAYSGESDLPLAQFGEGDAPSGIYGHTSGILVSGISGELLVQNEDGTIVGDTAEGVYASTVTGLVDVENGKSWSHGDGGTITGATAGVRVQASTGGLTVGNHHGTIEATSESGITYGVEAQTVTGGATYVDNRYGDIYSDSESTAYGISDSTSSHNAFIVVNEGGVIDASDAESGAGVLGYYVGAMTVDNSSAWRHGDGGEIYGAQLGVADQYGFGNFTVDNSHGTITASEAGDSVGVQALNITEGDVSIYNYRGTIAAPDTGVAVDTVYEGDVSVYNAHGVITGVSSNGVDIQHVYAAEGDGNAVSVQNTDGGIIYGGGVGVSIAHVDGTNEGDASNVYVDNSADWRHHHLSDGGLIYGAGGDGVEITDVTSESADGGNVTVDNRNTLSTEVDLNGVSSLYNGSESGAPLDAFAYSFGDEGYVPSGIYGDQAGVEIGNDISHIDGNVSVLNQNGLIWGAGDDGVTATYVDGSYDVDNANTHWHGGGLIYGDDAGVVAAFIGGPFTVENASGVIAGQTYGVYGVGIANGAPISGNAVDIDNSSNRDGAGGIIAGGSDDGVHIFGVGSTYNAADNKIVIDNSGYEHHRHDKTGGLIVGEDSGVSIANVASDVTIDNSDTRNNGSHNISESSDLPTEVVGILSDLNNSGGDDFLRSGAPTTGIWGLNDDGIYATDVAGSVTIDNSRGQIGSFEDDTSGIHLSDIGYDLTDTGHNTVVSIDNSNGYGHGAGGLITGGDFGVRLSNIANGNVVFNNSHGTTYGDEMGFALGGDGTESDAGLTGGDVTIYNSHGLIEGNAGTDIADFGGFDGHGALDGLGAITINSVHANNEGEGGNVFIYNGSQSGWGGGSIIGVSTASAISIGSYLSSDHSDSILTDSESSVDTATIVNGRSSGSLSESDPMYGGLIAGTGDTHDPVILLNTSTGNNRDGQANGQVDNYGVIASTHLYGFEDPDGDGNPSTSLRPVYDASNTVWNGLGWGSESGANIDTAFTSSLQTLNNNGVAGDHLITSSEGGVLLENERQGILFGVVDLTGSNSSGSEVTDIADNSVWNFGTWYTNGINTIGGEGDGGVVRNDGVIQTAFGSESDVNTVFNVATFYNDSDGPSQGILSSVDGVTGNVTTITGDFVGSEGEGVSQVALDAFLASESSGEGIADRLVVGGKTYGTTGLIINDTNSVASDGDNFGGILVVEAEGGLAAGLDCNVNNVNNLCEAGDAFYIDSATKHYEEIAGFGTIRDGLFSWFLQERPEAGSESGGENFYLVSHVNQDGANQAAVSTLLMTAWLDDDNFVQDTPDSDTGDKSGGADTGTSQTHGNSPIWGRISGSWSQHTGTTVTDPVTYNTSTDQSTYGITAGLEFHPHGDNDDLRLGLFGGYINSHATYTDYAGSASGVGGLVGGYAAATYGPLLLDAEVKADFMSLTYNANSLTTSTNGTSVGALADAGYRIGGGSSYVEPIASFSYVTTMIGNTGTGGATISYNNGQSIRAGAGARVGVTLGKPGTPQTELDLTGKVWDEFGGPNVVTIDNGGGPVTVSDNIAGIFGEVVGRATVYNADRTASGFVSVGGTFGADETSINAKAGLRKNF